jgi:hypothetical protein
VNTGLQTNVDEIAQGIFRFSTWVPGITEHGVTFNQFLLTGDEPFLFHRGMRQLFRCFGGHFQGNAGGAVALDLVRPR